MDDMFEEERFCNAPRTPKDVELGLERLPALDRVLGPSRSHGDFSDEPLAAALRLLSILSVANETWGELLFSSLTHRPLIAREEFLSYFLQDSYVDWLQTEIHFGPTSHPPEEEEESHEAMLAEYRFLMSLELRNAMFARRLARLQNSGFDSWERTISVSREGLFDGAVDALRGLRPRGRWEFRFRGEMGIGSGPTKEFYTEFSREARRHDLDLWAGDPAVEGSDGRLYAHPPCGLFPRPVATSQPGTDDASVVLGKVSAMSVLDDQLMDLNFSPAFYKALLVVDPEVQVLTLADLKHVAPSVYDFVPDLVVALRERSTIERNPTLTAEESRRAASEIKCNGASFDDLCIDFTLPGYPDVEMKPGGRDELLSVDNAEEYLKLLTWWLLYKGPQSRLKQMREGFVSVLPVSYLNLHRPDEFENFLPGPEVQRWTVSDLTLSCSLDDGLTAKTPVVRHLFDVLSSLAGEEQKQFIQFVTGQRRLPTGRLSDLQPRLTVKFVQSDEPDERLPSSSTCFNTLFLTAYSTREILREKLMLAVREGAQSFQFY